MASKAKHNRGSGEAKGLTCIRQRIHCAATTEGVGAFDGLDEIDQMVVDHFLETLARVALAVATRRLAETGGDVTCEP